MDKKLLEELIKTGDSAKKIAKSLGRGTTTVIYWIEQLGLSDLYKESSNYWKRFDEKSDRSVYKEEDLKEMVAKSKSYREVLRGFSKGHTGGATKTLKAYIDKYSIDTYHFDPTFHAKQRLGKRSDEELFSKGKFASGTILKKRLRGRIEFKCVHCFIGEVWNNKTLVLQLDHIDGDNTNNQIDNLRLLCPNCHSQTETFCSSKKSTIQK